VGLVCESVEVFSATSCEGLVAANDTIRFRGDRSVVGECSGVLKSASPTLVRLIMRVRTLTLLLSTPAADDTGFETDTGASVIRIGKIFLLALRMRSSSCSCPTTGVSKGTLTFSKPADTTVSK
jgi:hypothetical protein